MFDLILKVKKNESIEEFTEKIIEISQLLGPDRTSKELIPFISTFPFQEENTFLNIIENLKKLPIEKYNNNQIDLILKSISSLTRLESSKIHDQISSLFKEFIFKVHNNEVILSFEKIIIELSKDDLSASKSCSLLIFLNILSKLNLNSINKIFNEIIKNQKLYSHYSSKVRQSFLRLSIVLINYLQNINKDFLEDIIMNEMINDESPSVQILLISYLNEFTQKRNDIKKSLTFCEKIAKSNHWKARETLSNEISNIYRGIPITSIQLYPIFLILCKDQEPEIKYIIAEQLKYFSTLENLTEDESLEIIDELLSASDPIIISNTIKSLPSFHSILKNDFISQTIKQFSLYDSKEIIQACIEASNTINIEEKSKLNLIENVFDLDWRQKYILISQIVDFFNTESPKLIEILEKLLFDDNLTIREKTIEELPIFIKKFGEKWKLNTLIPLLESNYNNENYQIKQTIIKALIQINCNETNPILIKALNESLSNIRIVLAKNLPKSFKNFRNKLLNDIDEDVKDSLKY